MSDAPIDGLNAALEGRYRIERELGEGGMATVYLAEDLRHDRRVAIKVLKPELAAVVGAERFLAEIKTTASLQHPHILPLHDSGEADGFLFYVMPYVEGESLRDRLERERQLPVEEAVEIARKVADALDYAHERDVVHRDIKPANVLLSERGEPLVADFGIALALSEAGGGRITETGLSLGTPHYMSPEQASGEQSVDRRTDVYALGCVLYEMLTGEPPYAGPTAQAVLAKILTAEPSRVTEARKTAPAHVEAVVARALEKLPADRFASAAALAAALEEPGFRHDRRPAEATRTEAELRRRAKKTRPTTVLIPGAFVLLAIVALWGWLKPAGERPVARFRVDAPEEVTEISVCCGPAQALSPDGEWLVFVGVGGPGDPLYRRRLGDLEAEPIPGTEGASSPFFSPDSRWVGFHAEGRLQKVPVTGGPAVPITEVRRVAASWGDNDVIVFSRQGDLQTVPASGGTPTPVPGTEAAAYGLPWMLPDGNAALVRIESRRPGDEPRVGVVDLTTAEIDTLGVATRAAYASGHLVLSTADGTLMAQPFDPQARQTTGPAVAILDGVATAGPIGVPGLGEFALSARGALAYKFVGGSGSDWGEALMLRGPGGSTEIPLPEPGDLEDPVFSPDGRRIAFRSVRVEEQGGFGQIWIWDRDQRTQQLLTVGGETSRRPVWSPDGSRIAFASIRDGSFPFHQIYWRPADGSGEAERLLPVEEGEAAIPNHFSPDEGSLVFTKWTEGGDANIGLLDLTDGTIRWLVETEAVETQPKLSPAGRWLAYTSDRSGQSEVYVHDLDGAGGRTQVSTGGGHSPRWAPDGRTLYYATGEGAPVIAATVTTQNDQFRVTGREEAFEGPRDLNVGGTTNWDVSPDGQEFVYVGRLSGVTKGYVWVLNWPELLREMEAGRP